jgi:ATP-binding cassette subfamily C (CFTR/MRP) protein 1
MSGSGSSSFNEKEIDWRLQDQEAAAGNPKQYEPIVSEPLETAKVEKDLEVHADTHSTRGGRSLSRLQSTQSGASEWSSELSDTKSSAHGKKKWYKKMNPLKWGEKPPVPETRLPSREYSAGFFSRLTFQWMAPLMTVCTVRTSNDSTANAGVSIGWLQATARKE